MNVLTRACAITLALLAPAAAAAQSAGSSVIFPSGWAPGVSPCVKQTDSTCVPVSTANGLPIAPKGGSSFVTGQVSVGTVATPVAAARAGRQKIGVTVTSAVQCAFGNAAVTLSTGWPLAAVAYASDSWDTSAALYAVCASTVTVGYREQF